LDGLVTFTREFKGRVWLEVLFVAGVNDSPEDVEALARAIKRIAPERVQLNTVFRPPAEKDAAPVSRRRLEEIAARLSQVAPAEIIARVPVNRRSRGNVLS
jgi:wyosine [tRNA(Phe)-imidazoG37] synthetase (radical SAM superfamily)